MELTNRYIMREFAKSRFSPARIAKAIGETFEDTDIGVTPHLEGGVITVELPNDACTALMSIFNAVDDKDNRFVMSSEPIDETKMKFSIHRVGR